MMQVTHQRVISPIWVGTWIIDDASARHRPILELKMQLVFHVTMHLVNTFDTVINSVFCKQKGCSANSHQQIVGVRGLVNVVCI